MVIVSLSHAAQARARLRSFVNLTIAQDNQGHGGKVAGRLAAAALAGVCLLAPGPFARPTTESHGLLTTPAAPTPEAFLFDPREAAPAPKPQPVETASLDPAGAIESAAPAAARPAYPLAPPLVSAYARMPDPADPGLMVDPAQRLGLDLTGLREGLEAYRKGDVAIGDAAAAQARDPLVSTALEWALLRTHPIEAGYSRIARFTIDHPDWPMNDWLRKLAEEALYAAKAPAPKVFDFFSERPPETPPGRFALARALAEAGQTDRANVLASRIWREDNLSVSQEGALLKLFGATLTSADSKYRADRLLYKEQTAAALRAAAMSGADELALVRLRAAASNEVATEKMFADAPPTIKNDPGYVFARVQFLVYAKRYAEAAALMQTAPRDLAAIIDGDAWWAERRNLARKSLDAGDAYAAYRVAAGHAAQTNDQQIEAEFHAGWIALRYLNAPAVAAPHFDTAMQLARTPISRARAAYWRGRAAEAAGAAAAPFYEKAALEPTTFYGQLARLRLGLTDVPMRLASVRAEGEARAESVRAIELLYAAGAKELAVPLVYAAAKTFADPQQMTALAEVVVRDRDPKVSLTFGKFAAQHGVPIDDVAFPTYGVPAFTAFSDSAPLPIVYAIARQESAFDPKALSSAGAMGLMQMIASTARRTAQRVGVGFDAGRMTSDPVFNAQLGAAHLGDLLKEQRNSLILTFAAYNAGGKRVKEWIAANGDPRTPGVDPIDWIERIPIAETRNYVQRVMENYTVYVARIGGQPKNASAALRREARM